MSMLKLALQKIKTEKTEKEPKVESTDQLEQAMTDFQNATSASDRAAAFRAALELAK